MPRGRGRGGKQVGSRETGQDSRAWEESRGVTFQKKFSGCRLKSKRQGHLSGSVS